MLVLPQLNRATVYLTHSDKLLGLTFIRQQSNNVNSALGFSFIDLPSFKSVCSQNYFRWKIHTYGEMYKPVMVCYYSVVALFSPVLKRLISSALEKGATERLLSAWRAPQIYLIHIHIERERERMGA